MCLLSGEILAAASRTSPHQGLNVKFAAIGIPVLIIALLDFLATFRLWRSEAVSRTQKLAWALVTWLIPLLGSILALQISQEANVAAPAPLATDEGSKNLWPPGIGQSGNDLGNGP